VVNFDGKNLVAKMNVDQKYPFSIQTAIIRNNRTILEKILYLKEILNSDKK
jgi:hypothetical protein